LLLQQAHLLLMLLYKDSLLVLWPTLKVVNLLLGLQVLFVLLPLLWLHVVWLHHLWLVKL
jgi:hypothetical protein